MHVNGFCQIDFFSDKYTNQGYYERFNLLLPEKFCNSVFGKSLRSLKGIQSLK